MNYTNNKKQQNSTYKVNPSGLPEGNAVLNSYASKQVGEVSFTYPIILDSSTPFLSLKKNFSAFVGGFKNIFKNKKQLIVISMIVLLWLAILLLISFGINPLIIKILSFLTFAQGGISYNFFRALGGIIGKGIYVYFILSLFDNGIYKIKNYFPEFLSLFKTKSLHKAGFILLGGGIALISYNFFAGYISLIKGIIAIASLVLILLTLSLKQGFLYKLLLTMTSKKTKQGRLIRKDVVEKILLGMVLGFVLAFFFTFIPYGYTGYFSGIALILCGLIFFLIFKKESA